MNNSLDQVNRQFNINHGIDNATSSDGIIDLDLSATKRKKFRFDHDDNRIVELNTSDMNVISRIADAYPKLKDLQEKASKMMEGIDLNDDMDDDERAKNLNMLSERLKSVDTEMRNLIDDMFNANVSDAAAPDGSMYDPFEGSFRFEYIITLLINQYETNLQREYRKMEKQMRSHTDKYTHHK